MDKLIKAQGLLSITGAAGILTWWFLMPVFLPVAESSRDFENLILDQDWIPVNLVGLVSAILLTLGFPTFYLRYQEKFNTGGLVGLITAMAGLILFTSIQYYETLLWPAAARVDPQLVRANGLPAFVRTTAGAANNPQTTLKQPQTTFKLQTDICVPASLSPFSLNRNNTVTRLFYLQMTGSIYECQFHK